MRAAGARIAAAGLAAVLISSCSWGSFDDLKKDAWVQLAERDDTQTGGDFGIDVLALPAAAGANGTRFVISVGNPPAGLAQVTFDEKGEITNQIGFNAEFGGKGQLAPLNDKAPVFSLAFYQGEEFIAGIPDRPMVVKYKAGLQEGLAVIEETGAPPKTGRTVVVGHVVAASTNPDIVTIGNLSLTIVPNGDKTPITCNLKPPNPSNAPVVAAESLALARFDEAAGVDHIVVSTFAVDNTPRILVLKATDVVNGQDCPNLGFTVADPPPVSLAVGDLDGNGRPDIVAGALASGGKTGVITVYPNYTLGQTPEAIVIPSMEEEKASTVRGSRLRIADIDEDAGPELIASDSGASTVNQVSTAGQVQIYRWGACPASGGGTRGAACLLRTLYDPSPSNNDQFGRALAIAKFRTAGGEKNILAVAEKAKLWVFFKTTATTKDPRAN